MLRHCLREELVQCATLLVRCCTDLPFLGTSVRPGWVSCQVHGFLSADKLINTVIVLTVVLIVLTVVLIVLTAVLIVLTVVLIVLTAVLISCTNSTHNCTNSTHS